jgi:hypothetical protein
LKIRSGVTWIRPPYVGRSGNTGGDQTLATATTTSEPIFTSCCHRSQPSTQPEGDKDGGSGAFIHPSCSGQAGVGSQCGEVSSMIWRWKRRMVAGSSAGCRFSTTKRTDTCGMLDSPPLVVGCPVIHGAEASTSVSDDGSVPWQSDSVIDMQFGCLPRW